MFLTQVADRRDHLLPFGFMHPGEQRQTDELLPYSRGRGEMFGAPATRLVIVGVQVQWAPMDRAVHAPTSHFFQKGVAIDVQLVQRRRMGKRCQEWIRSSGNGGSSICSTHASSAR